MKKFIKKTNKKGLARHIGGFTLIETLIAISILLVAIVGPMEIAAKALYAAYYSRDQITAYYLAQEGIEFTRNLRDNAYLNPSTYQSEWNTLLSSCSGDNTCSFDIASPQDGNSTPIVQCGKGGEPSCILDYDSTYGTYSPYSVGDQPSKFTRTLSIITNKNNLDLSSPDDPTGSYEEITASSTISWNDNSLITVINPTGNKTFTIKETLFNWQNK